MAKKKAVRLPFVVAPRLEPILERIGSEESGQIEIERRGYLTVAEKAFMTAATAGDNSIGTLRNLAFKISRATGKTQSEVMTDIGQVESGNHAYLDEYIEEILEAMNQMIEFQERRGIIAATCLLMYRVDRSWGIEDTMELHEDLRSGLERLYNEEEAKNLEALEAVYGEKLSEDAGAEGKD